MRESWGAFARWRWRQPISSGDRGNADPSPPWGRGWPATGVLISRGGTGEGVKNSGAYGGTVNAVAVSLLPFALLLLLSQTNSVLVETPSPPALRSPLSPKGARENESLVWRRIRDEAPAERGSPRGGYKPAIFPMIFRWRPGAATTPSTSACETTNPAALSSALPVPVRRGQEAILFCRVGRPSGRGPS